MASKHYKTLLTDKSFLKVMKERLNLFTQIFRPYRAYFQRVIIFYKYFAPLGHFTE